MKKRSKYFIGEDKIDHNGEIFDYIRELHGYLWEFVRAARPGASGSLSDWVDKALEAAKAGQDDVLKLLPAYFRAIADYNRKVGREEVVEWIDKHYYMDDLIAVDAEFSWQAQKKKWGYRE